MGTHASWSAAARAAAHRARDLAAYLLIVEDDPRARRALSHVARLMRDEAEARAHDEVQHLAESLVVLAEAGAIEGRHAAELDAAVNRLAVLIERTSLPGQSPAVS